MEVKLGDTISIPFVLSDPTTSLPGDGTSVSLSVFEASAGTAEAYAPTVVNRSVAGNYAATVAVTTGNGFAASTYYEIWATASFGTATYTAPIGVFKVTSYGVDSNFQNISSITYKTSGNGVGKIDVITLADGTTLTHTYGANHQLTSMAVA